MSTAKMEWNNCAGLPIPTERRDQWAQEIAAGKAISTWSGDSIVFGQRDEDEIFIVDAQVRRTLIVPVPEGYCDAVALAKQLADALEALLADHSAQCEYPLVDQARAALRAAGRLP